MTGQKIPSMTLSRALNTYSSKDERHSTSFAPAARQVPSTSSTLTSFSSGVRHYPHTRGFPQVSDTTIPTLIFQVNPPARLVQRDETIPSSKRTQSTILIEIAIHKYPYEHRCHPMASCTIPLFYVRLYRDNIRFSFLSIAQNHRQNKV